jgi:hypothetical protein
VSFWLEQVIPNYRFHTLLTAIDVKQLKVLIDQELKIRFRLYSSRPKVSWNKFGQNLDARISIEDVLHPLQCEEFKLLQYQF